MGVKETFLLERMEEKKVTQADISRRTNIPPGTISGVLRNDGLEKTSYGNVKKICEALDLSVDDLDRIGPDGKLPAPPETEAAQEPGTVVTEAKTDAEEKTADVPAETEFRLENEALEAPMEEEDTIAGPGRATGEGKGLTAEPDAGQAVNPGAARDILFSSPIPQVDEALLAARMDPEGRGLAGVCQFIVMCREAACREEEVGHLATVLPSGGEVTENGVYAVRLPGSSMLVLRKVWQMEGGLLLVTTERFDSTPEILRRDAEGFAVIGRVVSISDEAMIDEIY